MDIWTQLARFAVMETQKVNLRPFQADDFDAFHELANDTEHLAFVFPGKASKQETDYLMVHSFMKDPLGNWAIARKVDNRLIGSIRLENYDRKNAKAEIGYFLASTFWNQGLMTDVLKTICFWLFKS